MLIEAYQRFLNEIIKMNEEGHYQGERRIYDNSGSEEYWIAGLNPRPHALNAMFFVYRGVVFMVSAPYYEGHSEKFMLAYFGRIFHLDQTMATELPIWHYEDLIMCLKRGY